MIDLKITSEHICDSYDKTMLKLIASYLYMNPTGLDSGIWYNLACLLTLNTDIVMHLVDIANKSNEFFYRYLEINEETIDLDDHFDYQIFESIINYYFIKESLKQIRVDCTKESLLSNYKFYKSIAHNLNMMNTHSGAYECYCNGEFSREHAPQSFKSFNPNDYIDLLNMYIYFDEYFKQNKELLPIMYAIISYQLISHANAMFLIVISQILKHSVFYNKTINRIASELYDNIHTILKDARVILVQPNFLYQDTDKTYSERNRLTDNTTRLHIMYGFDNYDTYSLRLDLCHEGICFIHYNNKSTGENKSFWFSKEEYENIISNNQNMCKCFIMQKDIYFLKDKINCNLSKEEATKYHEIENYNQHTSVFTQNFSESDVLKFTNLLNRLVINISNSVVDKSGTAARYSFNLDSLMCRLELFYLCLIKGQEEDAKEFMNIIIDKAVNYNLINNNERIEYYSLEGIQMIIELAKERCDELK